MVLYRLERWRLGGPVGEDPATCSRGGGDNAGRGAAWVAEGSVRLPGRALGTVSLVFALAADFSRLPAARGPVVVEF